MRKPVLFLTYGPTTMDNWKYLLDSCSDLRYRNNDPDTIANVLDALSFVLDEKGHGSEAMALWTQARDIRTDPAIIPIPEDVEEEEADEDEDDSFDDEGFPENRGSEGSFEGLVSNLRWFWEKIQQ